MPRYVGGALCVVYQATSEPVLLLIRWPGNQLKKVLTAVARSGVADVGRF